MLPDSTFAVSGLADRDFGLEEFLADADAMALDTQGQDAEDDAAYYLSPDSFIPFDAPRAA